MPVIANTPRGIQRVEWTNTEGVNIKYRVRIVRKSLKVDRLFDDFEEAVEFLNTSKTRHGKNLINIELKEKTEEEKQFDIYKKIFNLFIKNPTVELYINKYIELYVNTLPKETYEQKRIIETKKALYRVILRTKIEDRSSWDFEKDGANVMSLFTSNSKIELGKIPLKAFKGISVNDYVMARLKLGKKKSTIGREISLMSVCFNKLKYIDETLQEWQSPAYDFDKSLLKGQVKKRKFRLQESDEMKLFNALNEYKNRELKDIVILSLLTSMRRSEVINLTWQEIGENYITLTNTKNKEKREVFLTADAKDYFKTLPKKNEIKVFNYKVGGFQGSFRKFLELNKLTHIRFHDFRRESISRLIEQVGKQNSPILAELLGFNSIRSFNQNYINNDTKPANVDTLEGIMKTAGHNSQEIHNRYFVPKR